MEFTGRFVGGIRIDIETRKMEVTIQADSDIGKGWDKLRKCEQLSFTVKQHKQKRSLDANAYYWCLATKLADALRISKPRMHNMLLRRYGRPEQIDGKLVYLVLPDTESGAERALEAETYHIRPTAQVKEGADGLMYRTYLMLRGSSTYDAAEMGALIDGLVSECREQGIETMPPEELERMMRAYDSSWRKKHEEAV